MCRDRHSYNIVRFAIKIQPLDIANILKPWNVFACSGIRSGKGEKSMARILYVEDYPSAALTMKYVLDELGHECQVAPTGVEAVRMYSAGMFDLVLIDTQLPDMGGPDVARAMRAWESENNRQPGLLLGFSADTKGSENCRESGMNGFAMKSLSLTDVKRLLDQYLSV